MHIPQNSPILDWQDSGIIEYIQCFAIITSIPSQNSPSQTVK